MRANSSGELICSYASNNSYRGSSGELKKIKMLQREQFLKYTT